MNQPAQPTRPRRLVPLIAATALAVAALVTVATSPAQAATPGNDDLARAQTVDADVAVEGTTVGATFETGETAVCDSGDEPGPGTARSSVWYRFTASSARPFLAQTFRVGDNPDTVVHVYRGPSTGAAYPLVDVGCDDDAGAGRFSSLTVAAQAGTTYYIQVSDHSSTSVRGAFGFRVRVDDPAATRPANDDLAAAAVFVPGSLTRSDPRAATVQPGEPAPACGARTGSARTTWLRYTPGVDRRFSVGTVGADSAVLAVYASSGPGFAGLGESLVCTSGGEGLVGVDGVAGTTYYVQVGVPSPSTGAERPFDVDLDTAHDDLSRTTLSATAGAQDVTLTATVTRDPDGAAPAVPGSAPPVGSVAFWDGDTPLGSVAVADGAATTSLSGVSAGTHLYRAVFTSTAARDADSFARPVAVEVTAPPAPPAPPPPTAPPAAAVPAGPITRGASTTSVAAPRKVRKGTKVTVAVTVRAGTAATGTVTATVKGRPRGTVALVGGRAAVKVGRVRKKTTVVVTYSGDALAGASSGRAVIRLKPARR